MAVKQKSKSGSSARKSAGASADGSAIKPTRSTARKSSTSSKSNGFFITLEGGEGAGKSSQMALLKERFEKAGRKVVTSREPGGSAGAEAVRHVLLSGAAEPFGADMEAILFSASRADHVDTVIRPALEQGKIVISDRFFDSTRVYQGVSGKVDDDFVRRLERIACGDTWPDLTLIIDLDPVEGMKRAGARRQANEAPDRFEKESIKLQQLRREAYLEIAKEEPQRCVVIDGAGSVDEVFAQIWSVIEKRLLELKTPRTSQVSGASAKKLKLVSHKKLTTKKAKPKTSEKT